MSSGQTVQGGTLYGLAASSFTGVDENPLSEGGVWSTITSETAWKRLTNHAEPTDLAGTDDGVRYSGITWPNDQYSRAKLTVNSTLGGARGVGLTVRAASAARTYYRFIIDHATASNASIAKQVAGVNTSLLTWTQAFTDGDLFTLLVEDTLIQVYDKNMVLVASIRDTSIASGSPGLALSTAVTTASADDWEGGKIVYEVPPVIRRRQARDGMFNDVNITHWFKTAIGALACR